ncbi:MerC domain-containing protein [Terriglobus tenax]|uniref:MerC domain-containing protein n=1 Tax=Terriglobus tenax TaxID=1111115 RepID=UPI0021DFA4A4|nr:MerC domain-containing protein [Terriglobus tenax]
METNTTTWPDRLGIWASALCVVHCLLTPVLLSASAVFAHFLPSEEGFHRVFAVLVAALGTIALIRGYRQHRQPSIIGLMLAGFACITCGAWFGDSLPGHWTEVAITMCGSALMITAHRRNHTFCKDCSCSCE